MSMRGVLASGLAQKDDPESLGKACGGKSAYKRQADYQQHARDRNMGACQLL